MTEDIFETIATEPQLLMELKAAGLPVSDLGEADQLFWRLGPAACPRGYIGIESYDDQGLLRSLVVGGEHRGRGYARALVEFAVWQAKAKEMHELWLLTTTAAGLFGRLGWNRRDRGEAPEAIAASQAFSSLCPSTAICFSLPIGRGRAVI